MATSNKDDVFTHGLYGEDIGFLLNSPNCDPVDPEDEEEVNLIIKQEIEDENLEYKCRCCKYVADTFELLEKHENGHRARGTFLECEYCEFCTNVREVMIQHVTKHTGERPFKCQKCEFSSRWKRDLIKHQVKHSDVKNFMCTKCDFTTKWYNNIRHHMVSHSMDRPFTCHICDMKFKRKGGLDYHLYRHNDYKPKKCLKCDFRCKTNFELKYHQHKHSDVRNFACTFPGCVQRCKTKSDLVKHLKIHTNIRDKVCDICDKGFVTLANLSKHKLRHVTERKFQCDLCTRKFKTITSLRHHLQTHTDHKPFVCDICGHQCRNRHNLNTHKLVHSADRKYKCPICPYAGKFPFHIFAHIGTFHGDQYAYFCEICRKPFRRYSQLQTHCGRMHKGINLLSAPPEIKQEVLSDEETSTPQSATKHSPTSPASTEKSPTSQATTEEFGIDTHIGLEATSTDKTDDSPLQRKSVDVPETDIKDAPIEKEQHIPSDLFHQQKDEPSSGNIDSIPDEIKPKIEDPHVIIYNVGPFRLPLASKGFNFNFEKTGKKPKQWFMEPQNMTDDLAADKQRAYMEKKARNMERSRGATIRKFGWRKPPFKPSLEENPRYKRDKEIRRKGRESGRIFVKQAPELQDLINIGRANIRKIKICKRADLLMKNWKEVEVKLEKLDGYDIPNSYRPRSSKQPLSHETMSIPDSSESFNPSTLDNVSKKSRSPTKRQLYTKEPRRSPTKKLKLSIKGVRKNRAKKPKLVLEQEIELSAHPEQDSDTMANSEEVVSKDCTPKAKRSVGRPRKYPSKLITLKSTKIKSANDLIIPPLLSLSNNYINEVDHKSPPDPFSEEDYEANNIHPLVTATESSVIHSFKTESSGIISINAHVNTTQSLDTEPVPFTDSKTISSNSVLPEVTMDHHSIASSISKDFNTEDMSTSSSVTAAVNPDIRKQIQSQKSTGRLNLAISKLIAKTCISLKETCTKVTCTQLPVSLSSSIQALADCKRHRKSEMPRKVKKVCNSVNEQYYSDEDDLPLSTLTKTSQKEPLPILINTIKMEPEDTTTIDRETTSMKDTNGRQRKHHKATGTISAHGTMKKKRKSTVQNGECTEKETCKRMFENLKDPIKRTQNLTDLNISRKDIELQDVAYIENEHSQNQPQQQNVIAKICKPQYTSNLPLISIYENISLKELLSKPPEYDRDWTMLTTDLVGPEPDKSIMQLDIHDAQDKDDLIKIQKNLRTEKYRLKKLASESCTIKHINKLINTVKHVTYKISSQPDQQSHISDYPILKNVLMRGKESDNDVIITDDQDLFQKRAPIKLCLKKNVIFEQNDVKKTHKIKKLSDHLKKTAVDQLQTVKSVKKKTVPTINKVSDKALIASMSAIQPVVIVENICPAIEMKDDSGEAAKTSSIVLATSDIQKIQTKRKYTKKSVLESERTACNTSPVAINKMASTVTENIPDIKQKYAKKNKTQSNNNDDIIGNISAATTKKVNKIKRKYIKKSVFWNNTRKFIDQPLAKKTEHSVSKISDHHEKIKRKYTKNSLFWSQKNGEEISFSKPATISTNKIDDTKSNETDRKKRKYTKTSVFWSQRVNNENSFNKSATGHASTISHVENIKRKYSKKSGCWVEKVPKAKYIQPTGCFKVKSINKRKANKTKVKNTGTLPTGEKEFLVSVAVNGDDQPTSSDIRRVLQNYIANRRNLSSKKKTSKPKNLKMCMKKAKKNGSGLEVKKSLGNQKNKKSKNIKSTKKKNILKVKIPRKQKPNSKIEIYVDVEESETIDAEAVSNNSNSSTDQHYVDSKDVNCTVVLQPVLVLADDKFEMLLNTSIVKSESDKEREVVIKREPSDTEITDQARAIKYEQHVEDCKTTVHKIKEETDLLPVDCDNNNDLHVMKFESH